MHELNRRFWRLAPGQQAPPASHSPLLSSGSLLPSQLCSSPHPCRTSWHFQTLPLQLRGAASSASEGWSQASERLTFGSRHASKKVFQDHCSLPEEEFGTVIQGHTFQLSLHWIYQKGFMAKQSLKAIAHHCFLMEHVTNFEST